MHQNHTYDTTPPPAPAAPAAPPPAPCSPPRDASSPLCRAANPLSIRSHVLSTCSFVSTVAYRAMAADWDMRDPCNTQVPCVLCERERGGGYVRVYKRDACCVRERRECVGCGKEGNVLGVGNKCIQYTCHPYASPPKNATSTTLPKYTHAYLGHYRGGAQPQQEPSNNITNVMAPHECP